MPQDPPDHSLSIYGIHSISRVLVPRVTPHPTSLLGPAVASSSFKPLIFLTLALWLHFNSEHGLFSPGYERKLHYFVRTHLKEQSADESPR